MSAELTVGERSALLRAARYRIVHLDDEAAQIAERVKLGDHTAPAALGAVALELELLDRAVRKLWGEHNGRHRKPKDGDRSGV